MKNKLENQFCNYIDDIISVQNVAVFFEVSRVFNLLSLSEISLCYIESCFTTFADSNNFLELGFSSVLKVLASNGLDLTCELEVFNAAKSWLNHNIKKRRHFANDILLTIRLPLLSDHALKFILSETLYLYQSNEYVSIIKEFLQTKKMFHHKKSINFCTNRYCKQNKFKIVTCAGHHDKLKSVFRDVETIDLKDLNNLKALPQIIESRQYCKIFCVKNELFVIGGHDNESKCVMSVEKYSFTTNTWSKVAAMIDDRIFFSACAIIDNIFVIGGNRPHVGLMDSCLQFDTKDYRWKQTASLNEGRVNAACSVFEGRIVISGGTTYEAFATNTVQSYDHVSNTWSCMPNMIEKRTLCQSVAMRNKLYIIGQQNNYSCEVFDSVFNGFVLLKPPPMYYEDPQEVISIGSKILIFEDFNYEENSDTHAIVFYDVEKNEWSKKSCDATKLLRGFCCVKTPQLLLKSNRKLKCVNRCSNSNRKLKLFILPATIIILLFVIVCFF